jgi:hypothetical protein
LSIEGTHFAQIIKLAKLVPSAYAPPTCKVFANKLLDLSYENRMEKFMSRLEMDADVYGLSLFGDGTTVHGMPLMNILASGVHKPGAVLAIIDCKLANQFVCFLLLSNSLYNYFFCVVVLFSFIYLGTKWLVEGGKKDAAFIASLFDPRVQKFDPRNSCLDCVFFDGASNVQLAGQLLAAKYPRIHVQTCTAHSVSLFFSDVCKKLWQFRLMLVNYRRLFRLFGSRWMHSPYPLFCSQSKNFNDGHKVGLQT